MKKAYIIFASFLTLTVFTFGQEPVKLQRSSYKLTLIVDKDIFYEEEIEASSYILPDNTIQLYPGETIHVEIEQNDSIIKNMVAVKQIRDSSKTITISFTQITVEKAHSTMMLEVENPFPYILNYQAIIFISNQKKWINTNVLPVEAGSTGYETWPDIITSIGLGKWSFEMK